jgi:hypothetical protein
MYIFIINNINMELYLISSELYRDLLKYYDDKNEIKERFNKK